MGFCNRRSFLITAAGAAATLSAPAWRPSAWAKPSGANSDLGIGVIGLGLKGKSLLQQVAAATGVRVIALCDVDPRALNEGADLVGKAQPPIHRSTDYRTVLAHPGVDAVVIATGTHWHAPMTVQACQQGKDVHVEKPAAHTIWAGARMVRAAGKYGRIVQVGTQFRSDPGLPAAIDHIRSGLVGKILWIYAFAYAVRESVGRRLPWYPDWLDYDLYCGPAPMVPLKRTRLHYDWHFDWSTGNGDLPNMGVHMIDIARRFAALEAPPRRVLSVGGRFAMDDAGQTPNTQLTVFDYASCPVFFENRALPSKPGVRTTDQFRGLRNGIVVQCEGGYYAGYYGGGIYDNHGKPLLAKRLPGDGGASHLANFFAAVRSRHPGDLTAPIEVGHASTSVCHYGNISYRLGTTRTVGEVRRALAPTPPADEHFQRLEAHLAAHQVNLAAQPLTLGCWVIPGATHDDIQGVEDAAPEVLSEARHLLRGTYRPPYRLEDKG
jgi:predicted dehydrogenase